MGAHYWIGVVQADHVRAGVDGGFAQVGHGQGAPLRRMSPGDWLFYYSPRTSLHNGEKLQAFTAAGRIVNGHVYQVEMTSDFRPWRRDIAFAQPIVEAPIETLKHDLSFIADNRNWGLMMRRGHFEIIADDARRIADAMAFALTDEPLPPGRSEPSR